MPSLKRKKTRGVTFSRKKRRGVKAMTTQRVAALGRMRRRNLVSMGFLGIEKKFYDTSLAATTIPAGTDATGGEFDPSATSMISTPAQGDGEQNRDGKRINILSCVVNGVIRLAASELQSNPYAGTKVFVALVLDTQSNGAQAQSEQVFKNTAANADTQVVPVKNLLFGNRFRILKEKIFDLTPGSMSHFAVDSFSNDGKAVTFKWFIPFPGGLPVNFNSGTTASIANVIDNSLHIMAFQTNANDPVQITYNARIRFVG